MNLQSFFLAAWLGVVVAASAKNINVATRDGLILELNGSGRIESVRIQGKRLPGDGSSGGVAVRDAVKVGGFVSISGKVLETKPGVLVRGTALGLEVETTFSGLENHIAVEGVVRSRGAAIDAGDSKQIKLRHNERCIDLKFWLPIDCKGWRWGADLAGEDLIAKEIAGQKTTDHITIYPIAPISNSKLNAGISLAVVLK